MGMFTLLGIGYLIGSIPTAFLVVRRRTGMDLRREGSGNIGAMNTYGVTGSKWTGVIVMLLDAVKGLGAVLLGQYLDARFGWNLGPFWAGSLGLIGAVAGHNYNLWLTLSAGTLSGGKGLASAAGGLLLLMPFVLPVWGAVMLLGSWGFHRWRGPRDVIPGSTLASLLLPLAAYWLYGPEAGLVVLILALLVLPKHVTQMRDLWAGREIA